MMGSYHAAFQETSSPYSPSMSIWTHSNDFMEAFLKHSGDSYENMNPAIKSHVAWIDAHLRPPGTGGSEVNLNRSGQAVSMTPVNDRYPEITDLWGCCGSGLAWQVQNDTWDVVYKPVQGGPGSLKYVSDHPELDETRPVISTTGGPPPRGGGKVTMAWQTAKPYPGALHDIQWAILDVDGSINDQDTIPSKLDTMHPAIDGTLICYDGTEHGQIDRVVFCRDIKTEAGRYSDDDDRFRIKHSEKCKSFSRPRLSGEGRFVIYLAEGCDNQDRESYKQLHMTDLHTGNVYVVVEDFGHGRGDCIRNPGSCSYSGADYYSDNTDWQKYRYDIYKEMIVYSKLSWESTERCIEQFGDSLGRDYRDYDLHYYWIDVAAL